MERKEPQSASVHSVQTSMYAVYTKVFVEMTPSKDVPLSAHKGLYTLDVISLKMMKKLCCGG